MQNVLSQLQITQSNSILEKIDDYPTFSKVMYGLHNDGGKLYKIQEVINLTSNEFHGSVSSSTTQISHVVYMPLWSSILGTVGNMPILPLNLLGNSFIELSLTFNNLNNIFKITAGTGQALLDYTITNLEFVSDCVELSYELNRNYVGMYKNISIPIRKFETKARTLTLSSTSTSKYVIDLPFRVNLLRKLYFCFLDNANFNGDRFAKFQYSLNNNALSSMQLSIGSTYYPSKPLSSIEEMYSQTMRCSKDFYVPLISYYAPGNVVDQSNCFFVGFDILNYPQEFMNNQLGAGEDTTSSLILLTLEFAQNIDSTISLIQIAEYDTDFQIFNGDSKLAY
jgi:hypothetical protein